MKKESWRQSKTSPKILGFRGSQSTWIRAGQSIFSLQMRGPGCWADDLVGVRWEAGWGSPGRKLRERDLWPEPLLRGRLEFLHREVAFSHNFFQRNKLFSVYFVNKLDYVKETSSSYARFFLPISVGELASSRVLVKAKVQEEVRRGIDVQNKGFGYYNMSLFFHYTTAKASYRNDGIWQRLADHMF